MTIEYAIEGISKKIGIYEYNINRTLPMELKWQLPELEEISRRLDDDNELEEKKGTVSILPVTFKSREFCR